VLAVDILPPQNSLLRPNGSRAGQKHSRFSPLFKLSVPVQRQGEWAPSENNRRARYYKLTRSGRAQLAEEKRNWRRMTLAINWMLESEG
jgi:PadR family transcriptional regulator PadR